MALISDDEETVQYDIGSTSCAFVYRRRKEIKKRSKENETFDIAIGEISFQMSNASVPNANSFLSYHTLLYSS